MNARALLTGTTPGPWEAEPGTDGAPDFDVFVSSINERGERRGRFYIAESMTPANASLIASAPDLAARVIALEDGIKDLIERTQRWIDMGDRDEGSYVSGLEAAYSQDMRALRAILDGEAGE